MNVDASNTDLNSHICFNALATLQNIKNVENSCNFCSSSDHPTYSCPVLSQGEHVKDTSIENLSRSSVPHGLRVYENQSGLHIISVQKFAKGCRFGPLMAPKSYIPIENTKFPLTIFGALNLDMDGMQMPEFRDLFKVRHIHLDTRNEKFCNWMIHVDPAQYSNEQNLIAYEEDNEIFFAAIEDLDVGDILKVWYSPNYGKCMKMSQLFESPYPISKNILNENGAALPELQWLNNYTSYDTQPNKTEIMLPSIKTIIKPTSYVCYENRSYDTTSSHYSVANLNYIGTISRDSNGLTIPLDISSSTLLNLDDSISNVSQFNDLIDDDETESFGKMLNTSNESITQDILPLAGSTQYEKKVYPCQLCGKKYSTMTNIYRHVRAQHNHFLCSLCMNMFRHDTELKEHINKCPKSDDKKPQCTVCMQYFSNSWSLTRHLKIHVTAGECDAEILSEKKIKEGKKTKDDTKDSIDLSDIDKNSQDSFATDFMNLTSEPMITAAGTSFVPSLCEIDVNAVMPIVVSETTEPVQSIIIEKIENINVENGTTNNEKDAEISTCIVCNKNFKSKSCMNKHLRSVHTVRILTGVKRSSSHNSQNKNAPTKRSHLNENQTSTTHTGSPVNPMTAKALASKLNERNSLVKKAKEQQAQDASSKITSNDVPVPPLVSIQGTSTSTNRDSENLQPNNTPNLNGNHSKFSPLKNRNSDNLSLTAKNFAKKCKLSQVTSASDEVKTNATGQAAMEKLHECDTCGKKFNKKYELKRHKTVHENVVYTCPYCSKVVKRKQSIMKHFKNMHKDLEQIWSQENFVVELKQHKSELNETLEQSENSNLDERNDDSNISNGKFLFIDNISQNGNNTSIGVKDSTVTVVDYINTKQSIDNNHYTAFIDNNHGSANDLSGGEIYKNVFLSSNHIKGDTTNFVTNAPITVSTLNGLHHIQVIGQNSEDDETILIENHDATQMLSNSKAINVSAPSSLTNIIDDCFFADDALNCNVALNSPFSSDNDVDSFTMTNGTNDCVMNKDLLNKFQDRLEEMDDKIDSDHFKTIWSHHMLEDENLNDDIDENEEIATDSVDGTTDTNDYNNVTAVK